MTNAHSDLPRRSPLSAAVAFLPRPASIAPAIVRARSATAHPPRCPPGPLRTRLNQAKPPA